MDLAVHVRTSQPSFRVTPVAEISGRFGNSARVVFARQSTPVRSHLTIIRERPGRGVILSPSHLLLAQGSGLSCRSDISLSSTNGGEISAFLTHRLPRTLGLPPYTRTPNTPSRLPPLVDPGPASRVTALFLDPDTPAVLSTHFGEP